MLWPEPIAARSWVERIPTAGQITRAAAIPRAFVEVARALGQATVNAASAGKRRRPR